MTMTGRKPKPTAIKLLEGNPGKRHINEKEVKPKKKAPKCPSWLLPAAKTEWKRMCKQMEHLGILTEVDMAAFAGYCQSYARWKEAEEYITENGITFETPSGYVQQVPQVSIAQQYLKQMSKFCSDFGLTPSSRVRMPGDNDKSDDVDEMERLLS